MARRHRNVLAGSWQLAVPVRATTRQLCQALTFGFLSPEERAQLVSLLGSSRDELLQTVEGVTPTQWAFRPDAETWSIGMIAEHLCLTEVSLLGRAKYALRNAPDPDWEQKTGKKLEFIERVMPSRKGRARAPDGLVPRGERTLPDSLDEFKQLRAGTLQFVDQVNQPLKSHTAEHPFPIFGTLNAHQWLIYIPWHTQRHVEQMRELMTHAEFPADR